MISNEMHVTLVKFVQDSNEMELNYGFHFRYFETYFSIKIFSNGFYDVEKLELRKKSSVHSDLHINLELAILKLISSKSKGSNLIISNPIPSITEGKLHWKIL